MSRYKKSRYGRKKKSYSIMPKTALVIFIITVALLKTGIAAKMESAVSSVSSRFENALEAFSAFSKKQETNEEKPDDEASLPPAPDEEDLEQLVYESSQPIFFSSPQTEEIAAVTIDGSDGNYNGSGSVYIKNETDYDIDVQALLAAKDKVNLSGDAVQVLIMHTHGTEAYTPTNENSYIPSDTNRTTDSNHNMLRVGQLICDILNENGIKTIHSETLNDYPSYSGSYTRALEDISAYVKANPSIKMVIDVHRDAMVSSSGTVYKAVANINGSQAAQLMLVCGTDAGGLVHNGWRDNLSFQLKLQEKLNSQYPGIMRPLNIRKARFNEHVTSGSMLLEVGTSGNTLEEALVSARIFAESLSGILRDR
ncbi:MAG: stage II sporulation protein P [Clostridiaceae bacterium]|nr:stage II sporulation protein P [Clostridiaceae bacterium]